MRVVVVVVVVVVDPGERRPTVVVDDRGKFAMTVVRIVAGETPSVA